MTFARAEAFAPATVANLGVGFDILGLAVHGAGDTVIVEWRDEPGAVIIDIDGDDGKLPREPEKNVATVAANAFLEMMHVERGVSIQLKKGLPLSSGLGSSAASAVAPVVAINALLGEPCTREELLPACLEGEALVSGYHADNIGPSLFGGIMLITGTDASQIKSLPVPDDLHLALITPEVEVPTAAARAALPQHVTLQQMVKQTGAVARLMDAIYRADIPAMADAMEDDQVIEPARAHMMPYLNEVRRAARAAGAHGVVISGAGPTLCAVCDQASTGQAVVDAMAFIYKDAKINCATRLSKVAVGGAQLLSVI